MKKKSNDIPKVKLDDLPTFQIRLMDTNYSKIGDFDIKTLARKLK